MGDVTGISWCDHTHNPWWGCSRVSPACRFCYAEAQARRYGHEVWRRLGPRRMLSDRNWNRPRIWNRDAEAAGKRAKVFCASMADVFEEHPAVVDARARLWDLIDETPWLIWQLLTKRPENVAGMVPWGDDWPETVWIGTSVENQRYADERIPQLAKLPAAVRFLSCEPLIGPADLTAWLGTLHQCPGIAMPPGSTPERAHTVDCCTNPALHWVIVGGESGGAKRREMNLDWMTGIVGQAQAAGVPVWIKQDSGPRSGLQGRVPDDVWSLKQFPAAAEQVPA